MKLFEYSTCRKPCSGHKLKEVTGNKIFAEDGENGELGAGSMNFNSNNKTSVRIVQVIIYFYFSHCMFEPSW